MKQLALPLLLALCTSVFALDASDLSGMEGWYIAATTTVNGDFEGCDFDKKIRFDNGWTLACSSYSYTYSYRPDAVIFSKTMVVKGQNYWMLKALIDDEMYEMAPIPAN